MVGLEPESFGLKSLGSFVIYKVAPKEELSVLMGVVLSYPKTDEPYLNL